MSVITTFVHLKHLSLNDEKAVAFYLKYMKWEESVYEHPPFSALYLSLGAGLWFVRGVHFQAEHRHGRSSLLRAFVSPSRPVSATLWTHVAVQCGWIVMRCFEVFTFSI